MAVIRGNQMQFGAPAAAAVAAGTTKTVVLDVQT
jgi:hypothetical protein